MSKYFNKDKFIKYFISHPYTWNKSQKEMSAIFEKILDSDILGEEEVEEENEVEVNLTKKESNNDPFIEEGNRIGEEFIKDMKDKYGYGSVLDLSSEMNIEIAKRKTYQAIKENKVKVILEACFVHRGAVARLDAYIVPERRMIECKATTSSKFKYILDVYYQYLIMNLEGFHLNDIQLALIRYAPAKKNQVVFDFTSKCATSKSARSINKTIKQTIFADEVKRMLKLGVDQEDTLLQICQGTSMKGKSKISIEDSQLVMSEPKPDNRSNIKKFDEIILPIELYKIQEEVAKQKEIDGDELPDFEVYETNKLKDCNYKDDWLKIMKTRYEIFNVSGKILSLQAKLENRNVDSSKLEIKTDWHKPFFAGKDVINIKGAYEHLAELKERRVYYDFETISSGISSFDGSKPFSQIPFQCSIIKTMNLDKDGVVCNNLIKDPKYMDIEWLKRIVDELYWKDASYIVYNASFEKGVLDLMDGLIDDMDYSDKIYDIKENTWDLALLFQPMKTGTPFIISDLKGGYSIKLVEKHIRNTGYIKKLNWKALDYKTLNVGNGMIATTLAKNRFFNNIDDAQWKLDEEDLKEYCENDVVSMLMVEEYVRERLKEVENG